MFHRVLFVIVTFLTLFSVLYISPWARQAACETPLLGRLCLGSHTTEWNILRHLGGNGPWVARPHEREVSPLPLKCAVDQVHMISRHAERFPTQNAGARHLLLLEKLRGNEVKLSGSLEFAANWQYFSRNVSVDFEKLTSHGPYAGTLQAFNTGQKLQRRYDHLVNLNYTTNFWSCDADRDIETARHFAKGFFGNDWEESGIANLIVVPETIDRGCDTLTPGRTCLRYINDLVNGHDRGYGELDAWQRIFTKPIAGRLQKDAQGLSFDAAEIYSMMEMCGFEILAKGSSPWCEIFTQQEWLDFEYGRDLLHFYRSGPGNQFAGVMGQLWLEATTKLLTNEAASGVYASFVHDGDIVPLLATLGILDETRKPGYLPNDRRKDDRRWKTSDVTPMGGRLLFERVTCSNTGIGANLRRSYVRLFINDGIVDLEQSMLGAGLSNAVGMKQWSEMVRSKRDRFGDFRKTCGLSDDAPSQITFLKPQYQNTQE